MPEARRHLADRGQRARELVWWVTDHDSLGVTCGHLLRFAPALTLGTSTHSHLTLTHALDADALHFDLPFMALVAISLARTVLLRTARHA